MKPKQFNRSQFEGIPNNIIHGKSLVYQFMITLRDTDPRIWRRIQVPSTYSFWDLHVVIQDSMGWLDYHLHEFKFKRKHAHKPNYFGIPSDDIEMESPGLVASWDIPLANVLDEPGNSFEYLYDFGDNWVHDILFEGVLVRKKEQVYPVCLDGELACPPEDCGGISIFYEMLEILQNPDHEEFETYSTWLKEGYDPAYFNPGDVKFDNPRTRWKRAFSEP